MSPTQKLRGAASKLVDAMLRAIPSYSSEFQEVIETPPVPEILAASPELQSAVVCECIDRVAASRKTLGSVDLDFRRMLGFPVAALDMAEHLLRRKLPLDERTFVYCINRTADLELITVSSVPYVQSLVSLAEHWGEPEPVPKDLKSALLRLAASMEWFNGAAERKLCARVKVICGARDELPVQPGEAWSDQAIADLTRASPEERSAWVQLLNHCATADGSAPKKKWLAQARVKLDTLTAETLRNRLSKWLPLVRLPRTQHIDRYSEYVPDPNLMIINPHMTILRGLAWTCSLAGDEGVARVLTDLAITSYKKVPKIGPRALKVGNSCVWALGALGGTYAVGQLAILRTRVKFGSAQKEIEKAFNAAADALKLPRDQIEEMGVPSYGMEEVGMRRESFGNVATAELRVDGREVTIAWTGADGKPRKAPPASVKADHKEELKELQGAAKDVAGMLTAQSERIDSLFLLQKRWPVAAWRERYLDHPLVGTIARRLIWSFKDANGPREAIWLDGKLVNVDDEPIDVATDAEVELWHPLGRPLDDVMAWRTWLERHQVRQPFKQAHREVYLLTDAERRTQTYSNRFAAHVLRQHQFNALCAARGWRNKLRLMVDDVYPPAAKELPQWALRAEFWIEGIGDNYGVDSNDSGVYLRVATDQVRFYRIGAAPNSAHAAGGGYGSDAAGPGDGNTNEPLPLDQIPPLVLSEIMRDVDLFVGVASVGNDPTWQDGGPEGRYQTYWQNYSFGALSETAHTRRAVLESLLPRLTKIRDRCMLGERFLAVRGDLRTYKIHLGSGNILMEPNDQYLCIVPGRSADATGSAGVFLPFEGDSTLSIILSKAFLLADDKKIKDTSITRQINA